MQQYKSSPVDGINKGIKQSQSFPERRSSRLGSRQCMRWVCLRGGRGVDQQVCNLSKIVTRYWNSQPFTPYVTAPWPHYMSWWFFEHKHFTGWCNNAYGEVWWNIQVLVRQKFTAINFLVIEFWEEALLLQRDRATRLSVEILQLRIIPFEKIAIDKWPWSIYIQNHRNRCF